MFDTAALDIELALCNEALLSDIGLVPMSHRGHRFRDGLPTTSCRASEGVKLTLG